MSVIIGSRDLSHEVHGQVQVSIEGLGAFTSQLSGPLALHVATAATCLTGGRSHIVPNVAHTPWEVVSYDEERQHLTVRKVIE